MFYINFTIIDKSEPFIYNNDMYILKDVIIPRGMTVWLEVQLTDALQLSAVVAMNVSVNGLQDAENQTIIQPLMTALMPRVRLVSMSSA